MRQVSISANHSHQINLIVNKYIHKYLYSTKDRETTKSATLVVKDPNFELRKLAMAAKMDSFFVSHGSPMLSIDESVPARGFFKLWKSQVLQTIPRAILVISGHWDTSAPTVNVISGPNDTIYDFYGFPKSMYKVLLLLLLLFLSILFVLGLRIWLIRVSLVPLFSFFCWFWWCFSIIDSCYWFYELDSYVILWLPGWIAFNILCIFFFFYMNYVICDEFFLLVSLQFIVFLWKWNLKLFFSLNITSDNL